MKELIENVKNWGYEKGIIVKDNSYKQFAKVVEEVAEIGTSLNNRSEHDLIDAIGDSTVTLILLAEQNGLDFEHCLQTAYNVIKFRKGKTQNGVFIKESEQQDNSEKRICDLDLSVRLFNTLVNAHTNLGLKSTSPVSELEKLNKRDFERTRNFGPRTMKELEQLAYDGKIKLSWI